MKLIQTFGRTQKAAAMLIETIERRSAANTSKVEPVVRRILEDVRTARRCGLARICSKVRRACTRYFINWSTRNEMEDRMVIATSPELQVRDAHRTSQHSLLRKGANA